MYLRFVVRWCFVLGIATLVSACSHKPDEKLAAPACVSVTASVVVQKDVPIQVQTIGNVEAYSTVTVKTRVEGELSSVCFKEGQEVKKGDLLFIIDPRPFKSLINQFEANLSRDRAQLKKAEMDVHRYEELSKNGVVSQQEYDQYRTNFEAIGATVKADEAAVVNAKLQLGYCSIRSPINGRIGRLMVNQGNMVKANDTVLVTINQTKPIYVTFALPEQELSEIRKYMNQRNLRIEAIVPKNEMNPAVGELTFLNNEVNVLTGTILLKAIFANEDEFLWPKQFVTVAIIYTTQHNALVIPSPSIQTGQEGRYVYVIKPDLTVESRPVATGNTINQETVITSGLQPGEKVVTEGQLRLVPGSKVEIKNDKGKNL
jgi:membrane fusion protein, multidrug efflux system